MRKRIISTVAKAAHELDVNWLDLDALAEVEITSEDPAHPIESALLPERGSGWRAAEPGVQTVRLIFGQPPQIRRIQLEFFEPSIERTQEFVLRWSADRGKSFREIVRQQWNFSPVGSRSESEDYRVELPHASIVELTIKPDVSGGEAHASLRRLRIE